MPGTPPTTPKLGLPRYAGTDPADFPPQVNALADAVDAKAVPTVLVGPTPSFPATPYEGQIVDYVDADLVWRFRYTGAAPAPHKWVCLGGGWQSITPNTTYAVVGTAVVFDPQLQIPVHFPGVYEATLMWNGTSTPTGGANQLYVQPTAWTGSFATGGPVTVPATVAGPPTSLLFSPFVVAGVGAGGAVGVAYKMGHASNSLGRVAGATSQLRIRPVAVF